MLSATAWASVGTPATPVTTTSIRDFGPRDCPVDRVSTRRVGLSGTNSRSRPSATCVTVGGFWLPVTWRSPLQGTTTAPVPCSVPVSTRRYGPGPTASPAWLLPFQEAIAPPPEGT